MADYFFQSVCRVSAHWRFASGALHFNEAPDCSGLRRITFGELTSDFYKFFVSMQIETVWRITM